MVPLRVGSNADRAALTACFAATAFCEDGVCGALGLSSIEETQDNLRSRIDRTSVPRDGLDALIRLFVVGDAVDDGALARALSPGALDAMLAVDLVRRAPDGRCGATVRLVPMSSDPSGARQVFVASDRIDEIDGAMRPPMADIVFSGHNRLTRQFVTLLPRTRAGSLLDVCAGSGVGALMVATVTDHIVAADLTPRSCHFATFNCWLNDAANVSVREGDLFEAVAGESFDRIIAHPPYVPALNDKAIFRDGGNTGDRLLRGIVGGVPAHLAPGGTFHILTIGMDTGTSAFEARAREWLGSSADEFDMVFGLMSSKSPEEFLRTLVAKTEGSRPEDLPRWTELFAAHQIREVVYGALVGRRIPGQARAPQTRRVLVETLNHGAFDWLFRWFDWIGNPDHRRCVLDSRPVLGPSTALDVHYDEGGGQLVPKRFRLTNDTTRFKVHLETEGWVVALLNAFDGQQTAREIYDAAASDSRVPGEFSPDDFCELVCFLAERGLLQRVGFEADA